MSGGILIEYDHITFRGRFPENWQEVQEVPRVGETVTVLSDTFIVYRVHWWEPPIEPGEPAARIVLRTPDQYRRVMGPRASRQPGAPFKPAA